MTNNSLKNKDSLVLLDMGINSNFTNCGLMNVPNLKFLNCQYNLKITYDGLNNTLKLVALRCKLTHDELNSIKLSHINLECINCSWIGYS